MSIITKTKTSDLDLDNIGCPYIKRVFRNFADNITMLTIQEFIHKSKYPIDNFMVDNFFVNLNDDIPIYVTNELIEWCGYSGIHDDKKRRLKDLLQGFEETKDYWIYSNKEYYEYYDKSICGKPQIGSDQLKPNYPHPDTFIGKNKTKHIVLTVQCFKMILMMLTTNKAHQIRLYYISLEQLIKTYSKYQLYCQINQTRILKIANTELNRKVDKQSKQLSKLQSTLDIMNTKLDRATDERAPKTTNRTKHEEFVVLKLNDRNYTWQYYVIRCQAGSVTGRVASLRTDFPRMKKIIQITYQPNSKNLYNLMKENLCDNIKTKCNYIKLRGDYTEREFIRDINSLNDMKKSVRAPIVASSESESETSTATEIESEVTTESEPESESE